MLELHSKKRNEQEKQRRTNNNCNGHRNMRGAVRKEEVGLRKENLGVRLTWVISEVNHFMNWYCVGLHIPSFYLTYL